MYISRNIDSALLEWKNDPFRKPMLLHCERNGGASGGMVGRAVLGEPPAPTGTTRCQRVAALGYLTKTTRPVVQYRPSSLATKAHLRSPGAFLNLTVSMFPGFSFHEITLPPAKLLSPSFT